jgi:hypothetical protein
MEDAGFIIGGYLLTFATVSFMAWRVLRAGNRLGKQVPDDDKPWR